jgi:hypothetical protein
MYADEAASMSWSQISACSEAADMTASPTSSRLGGVHPLALDSEERPCREDFNYAETFFTRGLFRPRWLRRRSCSPAPDRNSNDAGRSAAAQRRAAS